MRVRSLIAALFVAFVGGCLPQPSESTPTPGSTPSSTPAPSSTPISTPTATSSSAPDPTASSEAVPCSPAQILLVPGQVGAVLGRMVLTIEAHLVKGAPCRIQTWPGLEIRSSSGDVLATAEEADDNASLTTVLEDVLEFHLFWASACGQLPARPYVADLFLLGDTSVPMTLPDNYGPSACNDAPMSVGIEPGW